MKHGPDTRNAIYASLVTVFGVVFLIEMITMQIVYASMDFFETPLSMYATGNLWFVVSSGLMMIGTSYLVLALLFLNSNGIAGGRMRIGSSVLAVTGISTYLLTIFQTDIGPVVSISGYIHLVSAHLHFILLPVAVLWISSGLKDQQWMVYRTYSFIFSYVLIGTGCILVLQDHLGISNYSGVVQKALIAAIVVWIIISAQVHLRNNVLS